MGGGRGIIICVAWSIGMLLLITIEEVKSNPLPIRRGQIGETVFDITKFGAKGDGKTDDSTAIIKAWTAACQSTGAARLLIPRRQFVAAEVVLAGPCTAAKPIRIDIQGSLLAFDDISSYSSGAWIMLEKIDGVIVTGGGTIDGRGHQVWKYSAGSDGSPLPTSLVFQTVTNGQMNNVNFVNSMGFHLKVTDSSNINVHNLKISAPAESPNTDGIHLSSSVNVKITDIAITTGDDCISVGHGTENILIARITCGPGHGISIGSLGKRPNETNLKGVTVINCTIIGTSNGVRIKTYHASPLIQASAIYFQDIFMSKVKNPIVIDQHYDSKRRPEQSKVRLVDVHYRNIWGTTVSAIPVVLNCSSTFPCRNVELSNINLQPFGSLLPLKSTCSNAKFYVAGKINPSTLARCA